MALIFADSFYFIAMLNERDELHAQVHEIGALLTSTLVTTDYVLLEVADAMAGTTFRGRVEGFVSLVRNSPQIDCVHANERLFARGLRVYASRPDKQWPLTDCISFVVMHGRKLNDALTHDHHFEQAGFRILL